jgi:hypothetical protein
MKRESRNSSLLGNGLVNRFRGNEHARNNRRTAVSKQRMGKHAMLETMFSIRSVRSGYEEVVSWRSSRKI